MKGDVHPSVIIRRVGDERDAARRTAAEYAVRCGEFPDVRSAIVGLSGDGAAYDYDERRLLTEEIALTQAASAKSHEEDRT